MYDIFCIEFVNLVEYISINPIIIFRPKLQTELQIQSTSLKIWLYMPEQSSENTQTPCRLH
jgi:hypothetical protein